MYKAPIIGVTCGDVNGVGPEIFIKSIQNNFFSDLVLVFFGSKKILNFYEHLMSYPKADYKIIDNIKDAEVGKLNIFDCLEPDILINPGIINLDGAQTAFQSLSIATGFALNHDLDAIITMPLSKHTIKQPFWGHTEYFRDKCGGGENLMFLITDQLKLATVTNHVPINLVSSKIKEKNIHQKLNILHQSLVEDFLIKNPKIAVLGLNPHLGDNKLIGTEDLEIILPVLNKNKKQGLNVFGPFSADSFFGTKKYKNFDGVLAMYHDQGLIPFKMLSYDSGGVNYTAGMPILRTSPDHGPAYNIAGKGLVKTDSFLRAISLSVEIYNNRL